MEKNLELLKNDAYLGAFIRKYQLSDDYILKHLSTFMDTYLSRKICEGCKGLSSCGQAAKGQYMDIYYDGLVMNDVVYCSHRLETIKKQKHRTSFLYNDIPDNLSDLYLKDISYTEDQKELYAYMLGILNQKLDKGLYIYGNLGVGKTYLCIGLANSLVDRNYGVAFVKVSSFFNEMKAQIGNDSSMFDKTISKLKKADYLFLDDIGAEAVSDFVRDDVLFAILDHRLENGLFTIFTSNLDKQDLLKHYTYDRKDKSNLMNAKRLLERIDILSDDYCLDGDNKRRV